MAKVAGEGDLSASKRIRICCSVLGLLGPAPALALGDDRARGGRFPFLPPPRSFSLPSPAPPLPPTTTPWCEFSVLTICITPLPPPLNTGGLGVEDAGRLTLVEGAVVGAAVGVDSSVSAICCS